VISADVVVERFSQELARGTGAFFVGSGVSVPSGLPDWSDLLAPYASDIGIETDTTGEDLPQLAQFLVNTYGGNRLSLIANIRERVLGKQPNSLHIHLSRTPARIFWTTNFDTLIEDSLQQSSMVTVRSSDADIANGMNAAGVEVLKVHGCAHHDTQLVLTSADFEDFPQERAAFAERLRHDLVNNSFLFVGYGYGDPNIRTVLTQVRHLTRGSLRQHFMLTRKAKDTADAPQAVRRQELWIADMWRNNIMVATYDNHDELPGLLQRVAMFSRGPSVFATGSHTHPDEFAEDFGRQLAGLDIPVRLMDGQSQGIGRQVIEGFSMEALRRHADLRDRLSLFPNPYAADASLSNDLAMLSALKTWRADLIKATRLVVAFDGGMGTQAEVDVALAQGVYVLPVPRTDGGSASELLASLKLEDRLPPVVGDYYERAEALKLTAGDVVAAVGQLVTR
jgi:hypothetical protein